MTDKPEQFQLKWKAVAVVMIMVCASVLMTAHAMGSGNGGNSIPVIIESGSGVETASYIIYKDGDYTCLKNGTTGGIEDRRENATYLLQYMLDHIHEDGVVYFAPGIYEMNYRVIVPGDIKLIGSGYGSCLYWTVETASGLNLLNSAANITIESLYLKGVGKSTGDVSAIIGSMNSFVTVKSCYMSDWSGDPATLGGPNAHDILFASNFVWDCDEGLEFQGVSNGVITQNVIYNTTSQGVEVTEKQITALNPAPVPCRNIMVSDNIISNMPGRSGQSGIALYAQGSNYAITFSNNVVSNAQYGFGTAAISRRTPDGVTVAGNIFNRSIAAAVYIVNGKNYLVSGNYFYDSNVTAISIGAIQNVTISNNYIYKTTQAGASGISITSTAKNATVYGNTILYTKGTGITTSSPSFVINSNTILGAGSYGIYVNGGGNGTISGNRVNQAVTIAVYINNAWNVMVIGNVLHSSNTGVKTFGASNWNYISYNNFRGCVVATNLIGANDTAAYNTGV